ncbi:hypothetical protein BH09BAC6_BH09BAC6_33860 [soil metagenome]|jgi:hypothetical protein
MIYDTASFVWDYYFFTFVRGCQASFVILLDLYVFDPKESCLVNPLVQFNIQLV